jgi:hypothetical protein
MASRNDVDQFAVEALPPNLAAPFWREAQAQASAFLGHRAAQA